MIKFLEKTWGPISFLFTTAWAILDFLRPLGNYIYILASVLLLLTIMSVLCSKNYVLLQKIKNLTAFAPDFIKNELVELWQPDGVVFWKKGLFQVLAFLTALSIAAAAYGEDNKQGLLSTKFETVASLQSSLGVISNKLDVISKKQEEMKVAIDLVKKETSEDPRKELANRGVSWNASSFWDALIQNDKEAIKLFIDGGFKNLKEEDDSFNLIKFMKQNKDLGLFQKLIDKGVFSKDILNDLYWAFAIEEIVGKANGIKSEVDKNNKEASLRLYRAGELESSDNYPSFSLVKINPLLYAVWNKNQSMVDFLIKNGASTAPIVLEPDTSAIYHKDYINLFQISVKDEAFKNNIKIN